MLASVPSTMLTEWMGYELASGLLGQGYNAEVLASIHEAIQQLIIVSAQASDASIQPFPRPHEVHEPKRGK